MSILRWILITALVIGAGVAVSVGAVISGYSNGWMVEKEPIEKLEEMLKPHLRIARPEKGEGPFPVVLIFPGCGGVIPDFHDDWARDLAAQGYLAVVVDSFTPRDLDRQAALTKVCSGRMLWGRERAGDVMAAIDLVRTLPGADPARIILFGQSHGSWAIMDLLAMDFDRRAPTNLHPRPDSTLLNQVRGAVLLYPYCGFLSLTPGMGWSRKVPAYMALAEADTVVSMRACRKVAEDLKEAGVTMTVETFAGVDHAFDQFGEPDLFGRIPYDEAKAKKLHESVRAFLRTLQ